MGNCCGCLKDSSDDDYYLTEAERDDQRMKAAEAAEARANRFQQGGGGERLKAKALAQEKAEKDAARVGGGDNAMRWQV